ncbi:hypothetical protein RRG08_026150 [Elysia crispata]|uniref:Uncharacterized protein n=1 Tax=Elysia crispata TaxID=231223 RepID=A0AAE1DCI4_9GAST|nr:hypothetical protein RRG08_026150 [Elysia crispata]
MKPIVTYSFYKDIFFTEFNLGFGRPKSDTCLICDRIATCLLNPNVQDDERDSLTREKELHLRKAESAYKLLSEKSKLAKTNPKYDVFTFDFQQNLPCPNLSLSDIFYTRLLWTYNFGVHDCSSDDGIMHIWKMGIYKSVDHIFLQRGHTFLPNDRDFSSIELRKRKEMPLIPKEWIKIIKESRLSKPFIVKEMTQEDFQDFKKASDETIKSTWKSETGESIRYRDVMWFSYGQSEEIDETKPTEHKGQVWCRYTCSPFENWKKVPIFKRNQTATANVSLKYRQCLGVKAPKLRDLQALGKKKVLPEYAVEFYNSLTVMGEGVDNENDEDYDEQ